MHSRRKSPWHAFFTIKTSFPATHFIVRVDILWIYISWGIKTSKGQGVCHTRTTYRRTYRTSFSICPSVCTNIVSLLISAPFALYVQQYVVARTASIAYSTAEEWFWAEHSAKKEVVCDEWRRVKSYTRDGIAKSILESVQCESREVDDWDISCHTPSWEYYFLRVCMYTRQNNFVLAEAFINEYYCWIRASPSKYTENNCVIVFLLSSIRGCIVSTRILQ